MKLRRYAFPFDGDLEERGILLVEPDDPEELTPDEPEHDWCEAQQ